MDAAKLAAFMCGNTTQKISEIYGVDFTVGTRLPLIQVPTTAGTGSEVTNISVITTGVAEKKGVVGAQLYADYAILDGDLTVTVPPKITAATGIDAMVHAPRLTLCWDGLCKLPLRCSPCTGLSNRISFP